MSKTKKGKKIPIFEIILIIVILIICILAVFMFSPLVGLSDDKPSSNGYTKNFSNISASEANDLINQNEDILVIDARDNEIWCTCQFSSGHLPNAELSSNFNSSFFKELKRDILVYSIDGKAGAEYCITNLLYNVTVDVYNLDGGYNAWIEAGFEVEKG